VPFEFLQEIKMVGLVDLPSFLLAGGFLVAQLVLMDLEPSHCPFIRAEHRPAL
jgi:hypothetical protein